MTTTAIEAANTEYRRMRAYYMAEQAVTCPKCNAGFARDCQSTGGGNPATVATHKARRNRVAHWTDEQRHQYGELARAYHRNPSDAPAGQVQEAEAAAAPIPTKTAKQPTPKSVRLTEVQAERIEVTASSGGITWVPTTHLSGDAANRQCANALAAKGIIEATGEQTRYYEAEYRLTDFGWQVYLNHRLIIRRDEGDRHAAAYLAVARWAALDTKETR